jgi:hypothetical protein
MCEYVFVNRGDNSPDAKSAGIRQRVGVVLLASRRVDARDVRRDDLAARANISETDHSSQRGRLELQPMHHLMNGAVAILWQSSSPRRIGLAATSSRSRASKTCYTEHYSPYAPVAQWIEHRPSKPRVAGSSPAGRATVLTRIVVVSCVSTELPTPSSTSSVQQSAGFFGPRTDNSPHSSLTRLGYRLGYRPRTTVFGSDESFQND